MSQLVFDRRSLIHMLGTAAALSALGMTGPVAQEVVRDVATRLQVELDVVVKGSRTPLPGAILYVGVAGQSPVAVASGVADIKTGARLAPNAKFRAGSIVKSFIATVVLQLVEESKVTLDDPLAKWLPAIVTDRFQNSDRMTVRMLLNHTSGIPEWLVMRSGP
jgi:D-alanyl-D-alanine carboxypeptidase